LLQKINELGAASIGLDLILAESDRTSPGTWQATIGRELGYRIDISGVQPEVADHDRYLAETLAKGPFVLGYEFLFKQNLTGVPCGLHPLNVIQAKDVAKLDAGLFTARGVICNRKLFSDAVSFSGFLNATPDQDGILRRVPLLIRFEERLFPSLALASLMRAGNITQLQITQRESGLLNLVVGEAAIPIDRQGNVTVNFNSGSGAFQRISAGDLLNDRISPDRFKGRIVLVGSSASGLGKMYQTPSKTLPSDVELHAQLLENLLTGNAVVRPDLFILWEAVLGLVAAALICISIAGMEIVGSGLIGMVSLVAFWLAAVYWFRSTGFLFSPFLPTFLIVLNYASLTTMKSWKNQRYAREKADDALILLKTSENNLNSIIKSVPDIIFRLDPQGRITFISPAMSRYTDTPDRFIGQPIFNLVAPDDLDKARYRLNEKRTGERATHELEIRLLLPHHREGNDETGYFSVSAEGVYRGDIPCPADFIGTQGIIRDITEQKHLKEKLLHAQKMEVVGNLAAGVAHDLNNILAGMVTYPDLLLLELPEDSPMRDKIAVIQRSGQKAAAIVQDLLTLARRGVKISAAVDLNRVISDYLSSPECAATRKYHPNITVEADLAPGLHNVKGSGVHLSKAIMNLLSNAAEAMPAGGTIRLSSYNINIDAPTDLYEVIPAGEYVCISVTDDGVGIAAQEQQKIFEPFYSKKSLGRSGSGLGMTVVWATVKDHDGYIDLQSREGEGTKIVVYLPASRETVVTDPLRIGLEEYLGTEQILIVDDMPEQVEIASLMLSKLGYNVSSATSGEAAVEYVRRKRPDLVVLDMIMQGGMDGLETYRQIIKIHPDMKVVITSGFSESERVRSMQQLGAGSYIQKPYTMERIGVVVRSELDR
jgi:PAS domain S-box-containing protein